ncbi:MAG: YfiR family protein [Methylococcaceae bacterium]|nr:YfiR family protein [Methylococcaceae bacterium]
MKKLVVIFCLLLFFNSNINVSAKSMDKQAVLAVLALNIARFTGWPEDITSSIKLCVIGDNIVQESFSGMKNQTINGKVVKILNRSRLRNLSQCQLLYISGLERNVLLQVLFDLKNQPVLTVGENLGFIQAGGMVSLEKKDGRMQLNINLPIVKQSDLVVSSRILKLAKIFDYPYPKK